MKRVKTFAIISAFLVAAVFPPTPAGAVGAYEKYTEWYADATEQELIGWRYQHCDGSVEADGYVTSYRHVWYLNTCSDGGGGGLSTGCRYQLTRNGYLCPAQCASCF